MRGVVLRDFLGIFVCLFVCLFVCRGAVFRSEMFSFSFLALASGQGTSTYQTGGLCSGGRYPEGRCDVVAVQLLFFGCYMGFIVCDGSFRCVLSLVCLAGCLFRGTARLEHCLTPKGEEATCVWEHIAKNSRVFVVAFS